MKKILLTIFLSCFAMQNASAQHDVLKIVHGATNDYVGLSIIDSLYFDLESGLLYVQPLGDGSPVSFSLTEIDGISLIDSADCPKRLIINYDEKDITVDNPNFLSGLSVSSEGAYVTVNNTNNDTELETELTGKTTDGGFLYNGTYKTTLVLAGVDITSRKGAAIDIQCGKRVALELKKGTVNTLVDCANGEQKAALYCKGHLELDKNGTLNVTGKTGHAISAKEYIKLKKSEGIINILGAVKDGIHCKQYFVGNGFKVDIQKIGDDGIQTELDGEENEDGIADGTLIINGGEYNIVNTTNGSTEGTDTDTAKGLNSDGNMQLTGGTISIAMSGTGGKGIRVEGTYTQGSEDGEGPVLTVSTTGSAYSSGSTGGGNTGGWGGGWGGGGNRPGGQTSGSDAKAIKVMGAATVLGGTTCVTTTQSGAEGLESKTSITIKGGSHYFKCYDDCINTSGIIDFAGGNTVCFANGNDAVDSNYGRKGAITISGGNVFAYTSKGSPEEGLDCDNNSYIVITGGIAVSAGGSQGGGGGGWGGSSSSSQSVGSSTQGYYLGSSPSSYSSSSYYTLYNTNDEPICTYCFDANVSNTLSLLTAPNLGKGSVKVKSGTSAPTEAKQQVNNSAGKPVFFIEPKVTASTTTATVTAK